MPRTVFHNRVGTIGVYKGKSPPTAHLPVARVYALLDGLEASAMGGRSVTPDVGYRGHRHRHPGTAGVVVDTPGDNTIAVAAEDLKRWPLAPGEVAHIKSGSRVWAVPRG